MSFLLAPLIELLSKLIFKALRQPDQALYTAICANVFFRADIKLAVSGKPRCYCAAAHGSCKRGKLHAARRVIAPIVTVNGHNTVTLIKIC